MVLLKSNRQFYTPLLKYLLNSKFENELIIAYDDSLDMLGHRFGPNSIDCQTYARFLDQALQKTYGKMKERFGNDFIFIIFSDHGQSDFIGSVDIVSELRDVGLEIGKDYFCFIDATMALFWPKVSSEEEIISKLNKSKVGQVIDRKLRKAYHIDFKNRKFGDIIFALRPGFTFFRILFSSKADERFAWLSARRKSSKSIDCFK